MQYEEFIRKRITELRLEKNISEYRMSIDLGHSSSYIRSITSGKSLPSMSEFLYICDYLSITPKDFFDESIHYPESIQKIINLSQQLDKDSTNLIIQLLEKLKQ